MPEPRFWIGVTRKEHVDVGIEGGFVMFAHGKRSAVQKLSRGDYFAYYAPMTIAGEPVRAFTGIGVVEAAEPQERVSDLGSFWRRQARYFAAQPADVYPLLEQFSFIKDRSHWGMAFHKSLFEVSRTDFTVIADAMGVALH
jgi:hypothetical protein